MSERTKCWMLVSDLDGTLLGDDDALERFRVIWEHSARSQAILVYSSGRFVESMKESARMHPLPEPDYWIGGVGTQMEQRNGRSVEIWEEHLRVGWNHDRVFEIIQNWPGVQLQPPEFQSHYKVSGYLLKARPGEIQKLQSALDESGVDARIVYSSERDLDLLPKRSGKGMSAKFLAQHLSISMEKVICSGDSGNDLEMFQAGFGGGIWVGNCHEGLSARTPGSFQATELFASGVIQGLRHYASLTTIH